MAFNQVLYVLTWAYLALVNFLRDRPGVFVIKSKHQKPGEDKKVLISFVLRPLYKTHFLGRIRYYFSINGLTLFLIRAFNELGYDCHVIEAAHHDFKVQDNYQAAVFHVGSFDQIYPQLPPGCVTMAFETGAYWRVHNAKEQERFVEFKSRHGVDLPLDRWHNKGEETDRMLKQVNGILALGDYFTREAYQVFPRVYPINSAFLEDTDFTEKDILSKDFEKAKSNFWYFGGGGEIHKGLDLLVEVFFQLPHLQLFICTSFSPGFLKVYGEKIAASPNIHMVGYLPQRSQGFYKLVNSCAFNLHPSCSEGSPGGVIELLQYGIIPVVSYESNIVVKDFGFQLKDHSLAEIKDMVIRLSQLPTQEVQRLALETRKVGFEKFSSKVFLSNLQHILKQDIKVP
jgi:hypothetical protein